MNKTPVHNIEIEQTVLGAFFDFPKYRDMIVIEIKSECFYKTDHKTIFVKGLELYNSNSTFDLKAMQSKFGSDYSYILLECTGKLVSGEQIKEFLDKLIELAQRRKIQELAYNILNHAESTDITKIIRSVEIRIGEIETGEQSIRKIGDIALEYSSAEKYKEMSETCVKSNDTRFNEIITIKKGDFIVMAGRPSMGKTAMMLYLAESISHKHNVGIISIEMLSQYLLKRMALAKVNNKNYDHYVIGLSKISNLPIWINDINNFTLAAINNVSKTLIKKHKCEIIFIDYLQLLSGEGRSLYEKVTDLSHGIKELAKKTKVPHFVLAQLSRESEKRVNHKPMLSDIRDSGSVEQDADIVLLCYRPAYYEDIIKKHNEGNGKYKDIKYIENYFELIIAKQRDGEIGTLQYYYDKSKNYFAPLEIYKAESNQIGF